MLKLIVGSLVFLSPFVFLLSDARAQTVTSTGPTSPITEGQRVFACTHSFYPYVPNFVRDLAASANIAHHQVIGVSMIGGSRVIQHWDVPDDKNKVKPALTAGMVDVLTLAPLTLPDDGIEKFVQLGLDHNPNIRVLVAESWIPFDDLNAHYWVAPKIPIPQKVDRNLETAEGLAKLNAPYIEGMEGLVTSLNQKFGKQVLYVVPACQAVTLLRTKIMQGEAPGLKDQNELFLDPTGHPTPVIMALAGYCHFAVIYRRSPVGLPLPKLSGSSQVPNFLDSAVNPDADKLNNLLQQLAWQAVTSDPLSGVRQ